MMSLRKALMAATILSLPLAAQAQPITGLYVGAGAGANWVQSTTNNVDSDSSTRVRLGLPNDSLKAKYELGWGGVASIGWGFGNGLRLEAEGSYRENDIDNLSAFGTRGYDGTSLDDLARDLGIRKQTILYWFPSKEALLAAVVDRCADEVSRRLVRGLDGASDGFGRVEAMVRALKTGAPPAGLGRASAAETSAARSCAA